MPAGYGWTVEDQRAVRARRTAASCSPDGSIADVALDLDTLARLSKDARERYGLAGAVQHGASTLPDAAFHNFPRTETAEIHLATNFQNMLFDHLPTALRQEIYEWLRENAKDERKPTDTDEQFFYKTRKKALGPFKRRLWDLPDDVKATMAKAYDAKFEFLFTQLAVGNTAGRRAGAREGHSAASADAGHGGLRERRRRPGRHGSE